jgi:hypothetical protein
MAVETWRSGASKGTGVSLRDGLGKLEEDLGYVTRHSGREHAEMRERFELGRVVSCGSREHRGRTNEDLGS